LSKYVPVFNPPTIAPPQVSLVEIISDEDSEDKKFREVEAAHKLKKKQKIEQREEKLRKEEEEQKYIESLKSVDSAYLGTLKKLG